MEKHQRLLHEVPQVCELTWKRREEAAVLFGGPAQLPPSVHEVEKSRRIFDGTVAVDVGAGGQIGGERRRRRKRQLLSRRLHLRPPAEP